MEAVVGRRGGPQSHQPRFRGGMGELVHDMLQIILQCQTFMTHTSWRVDGIFRDTWICSWRGAISLSSPGGGDTAQPLGYRRYLLKDLAVMVLPRAQGLSGGWKVSLVVVRGRFGGIGEDWEQGGLGIALRGRYEDGGWCGADLWS